VPTALSTFFSGIMFLLHGILHRLTEIKYITWFT